MLYAAQHLSLACTANLNNIAACQTSGEMWVRSGNQLAIQVPSAAIAGEFNILLSPLHPGYGTVQFNGANPAPSASPSSVSGTHPL